MASPLPGEILRLGEEQYGVRAGHYVLRRQGLVLATLCLLGEDENGDVCATDELLPVHVELLDVFIPIGLTVDLQ